MAVGFRLCAPVWESTEDNMVNCSAHGRCSGSGSYYLDDDNDSYNNSFLIACLIDVRDCPSSYRKSELHTIMI